MTGREDRSGTKYAGGGQGRGQWRFSATCARMDGASGVHSLGTAAAGSMNAPARRSALATSHMAIGDGARPTQSVVGEHIVKQLARQAKAADPRIPRACPGTAHPRYAGSFRARTVLNNGANLSVVQDLLGHASPATTKRIYAASDRATLRTAARAHAPRISIGLTRWLGGAQCGLDDYVDHKWSEGCLATTPIARLVTLARGGVVASARRWAMPSSLPLFRVAGIQIGIHSSCIFAFVLITWSLALGYFPSGIPHSAWWVLDHRRHRALLLLFSLIPAAHRWC